MIRVTPEQTGKLLLTVGGIWFIAVVAQGLLAGAGRTLLTVDFNPSGAFGDSFGPLASFMAAVAALGAWRAVLDQRTEFKKSEEREADLRKESAKRDFESTFFNLTAALDRIVQQIDVGRFYNSKTGKDAFAHFVKEIYDGRDRKDVDFSNAYVKVFFSYQNDLGHYLRTLFNIVHFAAQSDAVDGYFYIRLVRATLSEPELVILALNGLHHEEGREFFKPLIEKYALLNNISASAKADFDLTEQYEPEAFGRPDVQPSAQNGDSNAE